LIVWFHNSSAAEESADGTEEAAGILSQRTNFQELRAGSLQLLN